jgi:hypothetical protein
MTNRRKKDEPEFNSSPVTDYGHYSSSAWRPSKHSIDQQRSIHRMRKLGTTGARSMTSRATTISAIQDYTRAIKINSSYQKALINKNNDIDIVTDDWPDWSQV